MDVNKKPFHDLLIVKKHREIELFWKQLIHERDQPTIDAKRMKDWIQFILIKFMIVLKWYRIEL